MEFVKTQEGSRLTVAVSGELNTVTAPELDAAIAPHLDAVDSIVFDFSNLDYIASSGLRILLVCEQALEDRGGVTVRGASPVILEIIEIAGLDSIITIA